MTSETPAQTAQRIEELIRLTERLTAVVAEQCRCFEARRPQDAAAYLDEIGRLANAYRHECGRIRSDPRLVSGLAPAQRTRLTRATEAFDAVLARQARAVAAAKIVTEGLMKAIAEEVAAQRQSANVYGAAGTTRTQAGAATAITLNQRA